MNLADIQPGDRLVHRRNALLSGWVRGVDALGPAKHPGPCVWMRTYGNPRGPWRRVGAAELSEYTKGARE